MNNEKLLYELIDSLNDLKKTNFSIIHQNDDLSNNERMVLFIIHNLSKEDRISLATIRDKIKLAPSTITPIISSLEKRGLIERKIDETDRRNIFVYLSESGKKFTKKVDNELKLHLNEYIQYMGDSDIKKLIQLIEKTNDFVKNKKGDK